MKTFVIDSKNQLESVCSFISKNIPSLNKRNILRYLRLKKILVNNNAVDSEYILKEKDIIYVDLDNKYFEFEHNLDFLNTNLKLEVIYEDDNIVIMFKPKNLLSQPDVKEKINTLSNAFKKYLYDKKQYNPSQENYYVPSLCNRLDFNTSGLVIGAKNIYALRIINLKISNFEIKRFYLAWVNGMPPKKEDTLVGYLNKDHDNNKVEIYDQPGEFRMKVITKYKLVKTVNNESLLELELVTGKSHQLRAHMNKIGCSIINDRKYNSSFTINSRQSQELIAYKIIFNFITDAEILNYLKNKIFSLDII